MAYHVEFAARAARDLEILYVIYEIQEQQQTVWVLTIRHGARKKIQTADLG
jgi:mRNA-degrading endonuclease RelE of RelBE toxin-antitoxin system